MVKTKPVRPVNIQPTHSAPPRASSAPATTAADTVASGDETPAPAPTLREKPPGLVQARRMNYADFRAYFRLNTTLDSIYQSEVLSSIRAAVRDFKAALAVDDATLREAALRRAAGNDDASISLMDLEDYASERVSDLTSTEAEVKAAAAATKAALEAPFDPELGSPAVVIALEFESADGARAFLTSQGDGDGSVPDELFERAAEVEGGASVFLVHCLYPPQTTRSHWRIRVTDRCWKNDLAKVKERAQLMTRNLKPGDDIQMEMEENKTSNIEMKDICRIFWIIMAILFAVMLILPPIFTHYWPETVSYGNSARGRRVNYYGALEIERTATPAEIKKAYYAGVRLYHPDHHPNCVECPAKFARILEAYEVLSDPKRKAFFDEFGRDLPHEDVVKAADNAPYVKIHRKMVRE